MALNPQLSSGLRKALLELNEMRTLFDGGELHIFADDGTGQPADANTTESGGGTQLAVVDLPDGTTTQVQNGDFTTDTLWTKGTGWTISAGTASCDGTQAGDSDLTQASADLVAPLINGVEYEVTFTVSGYTAGNITPRVGGTLGTARNANGTYTETIAAGAGADIDFRGDVNLCFTFVDFLSACHESSFQMGGNRLPASWRPLNPCIEMSQVKLTPCDKGAISAYH